MSTKQAGKVRGDIRPPKEVSDILGILDGLGHAAFVVGGCVRDRYIGREPKDWDIATSMEPQEVIDTFRERFGYQVIPTGLKHGTVTLIPPESRTPFEVTTFRTDGDYSDGRHPDTVRFAKTIEEDLSRRDLTMNAMAWSPRTGLMDPYDGLSDIRNGVVRTVGDPDQRFHEDALRMMRAVRFCAQLGFAMDGETADAIRRNAQDIRQVSQERRTDEVKKILMSPSPARIKDLEDTGLMRYVLPEVHDLFSVRQNNPHHVYDVGNHTMKSLENTPAHLETRLAVLFHDIGKARTKTVGHDGYDHFRGHAEASAKMTRSAMHRMRFPTETVSDVSKLVGLHDYRLEPTQRSVRRFVSHNGLTPDMFQAYYDVRKADILGQNPALAQKKLDANDAAMAAYREIMDQPLSVRDLQVDGHDAMATGYSGRDIGAALNGLLEKVLDDPGLNDRDRLMELLRQRQDDDDQPGT